MGLRETKFKMGEAFMASPTIYRGVHCAHAYVGGNWNNDLNAGPFNANLNNTATNTNTNIGAALPYPA